MFSLTKTYLTKYNRQRHDCQRANQLRLNIHKLSLDRITAKKSQGCNFGRYGIPDLYFRRGKKSAY